MAKLSSLGLIAHPALFVLLAGCASNAETYQKIDYLSLSQVPSHLHADEHHTTGNHSPAEWIKKSKEIANAITSRITETKPLRSNISETIAATSRLFLGTPYKGFSLDQTPSEIIRIDLTSFDCFLFVEQILALSWSTNSNQVEALIQRLRYRDGDVSYCNRYHYFTQWAINAERMGLILPLPLQSTLVETREVKLDFMSRHPNSYLPMTNSFNRQCIQQLEADLEIVQSYVPTDRLPAMQNQLKSGDIFGLVTRIKGLDVTHVGIIEVSPNSVNAIHAAPNSGVIRSQDIARYASRVPDVIGVTFYRPTDRGND
jgi:hypothetical protein